MSRDEIIEDETSDDDYRSAPLTDYHSHHYRRWLLSHLVYLSTYFHRTTSSKEKKSAASATILYLAPMYVVCMSKTHRIIY